MPDTPLSVEAVQQILAKFQDPETGRPVTSTGQVKNVSVDGQTIHITLGLTSFMRPIADQVRTELVELLTRNLGEGVSVEIELADHHTPAMPLGDFALPVKSVIAVGSGKGGVGKSTIATLLALGLAHAGSRIGLLDADIYGPSVPHLLGTVERPESDGQKIVPVRVNDIQVMSMGLLVDPEQAMMWRGPMLHGVLTQFFKDTAWDELDYLIVDMPPGTGDVPMSLTQLIPLTGTVVVCTPQTVALLDAVRAITMYRKIDLNVLGIVENMSYFACPECHSRHAIFNSGGAAKTAEKMQIPLLGEVPINVGIRTAGDEGMLTDIFDPTNSDFNSPAQSDARQCAETICRNLVAGIAKDRRSNPPTPKLNIL